MPFYMIAQIATPSPAGEYYLRGVMETASGFKLDNDGSFQFFFSYGALDRFGSGQWTSKGNQVILNSQEKHPADFAPVQSKKTEGDNITVKMTDSNTMMLRHIYCVIQAGDKKQEGLADAAGTIIFTPQAVDSIVLIFEFCAEKQSIFAVPVKNHNYFEFRFEPWILEVLFENFVLQINDAGFSGMHPLLKGKSYSYEKRGHR
ncbi:MAG: hypothetical protein JWM28_1055 [Chitinophagaceae bacterium]|nr:hypothetical protein [Chitinophagaceae bacterium]